MEKVLEEIKKFVTKPVTNLMEKEQNEDYKVSGIKTLVTSAIMALITILSVMSAVDASIRMYAGSYTSAQEIDAAKNLAFQQLNLFGLFFQVFAITIGIIAGAALVLFVVSKLMKVEKSFKNSLALAANYSIYMAVAIVLFYLLQFINQYLAIGVTLLIAAFSSYALKYAFKNSLGEVDDDKLTIFASVVVTVITIVGAIIIYNILMGTFVSMAMGSLGGRSLNSYNSLNSLNSLYNLY